MSEARVRVLPLMVADCNGGGGLAWLVPSRERDGTDQGIGGESTRFGRCVTERTEAAAGPPYHSSIHRANALCDPKTSRSRFVRQMFEPITEEFSMNKDQVKGAAKDIGGKIQEEAGKLVGSKEQEAKGLKHQAEGKMQKGVGDLKEAVADLKVAVTKR